MTLTLFVLPGDNRGFSRPNRAIASFGCNVNTIIELSHRNKITEYNNIIKTDWYCFLFDNEWIDMELKEALSIFLKMAMWDVLVFWKKVKDKNGEPRFYKVPRIFRKHVILESENIMPINPDSLTFESILNGWLREDDRI